MKKNLFAGEDFSATSPIRRLDEASSVEFETPSHVYGTVLPIANESTMGQSSSSIPVFDDIIERVLYGPFASPARSSVKVSIADFPVDQQELSVSASFFDRLDVSLPLHEQIDSSVILEASVNGGHLSLGVGQDSQGLQNTRSSLGMIEPPKLSLKSPRKAISPLRVFNRRESQSGTPRSAIKPLRGPNPTLSLHTQPMDTESRSCPPNHFGLSQSIQLARKRTPAAQKSFILPLH